MPRQTSKQAKRTTKRITKRVCMPHNERHFVGISYIPPSRENSGCVVLLFARPTIFYLQDGSLVQASVLEREYIHYNDRKSKYNQHSRSIGLAVTSGDVLTKHLTSIFYGLITSGADARLA